jgi:hypothetical protein
MHFVASMVFVGAVLTVFCFGLPNGTQFAGPNTFIPGMLGICLLGVALGVLALQADRRSRGEG